MKLVMTLLVRDEADVLPANLAFHLEQGVDFFIITDHRSVDATPDIIRQYELAGLARGIRESSDHLDQAGWVTDMARLAASEHDADWVINNDGDEFWWPLTGDLRSTFTELDRRLDVVDVPRHDFVALHERSVPFHRAMVIRKAVSKNVSGVPLPPKTAHRAHADVVVAPGNHSADLPGDVRRGIGPVEILHFPLRTESQLTSRIVLGVEAMDRNPHLAPWVSTTWRELYAEYRRDGLADHFASAVFSSERVAAGLDDGSLVVDRRLADYLDALATGVSR